ncbi:MAG: hypothetical protein ACM3ND_14015 [Acidobacteriota bacterium]|jgi:hypothetical protein
MTTSIRPLHPSAGEARRRRRRFFGMTFAAAGLGAILGFTLPGATFAAEGDPFPTITIQVYNYSQASPALLTRAEREAGRILGEAGLRTVWLECLVGPSTITPKGRCQKPLEATDLRLRVLSAAIENRFQPTVFGFTIHPAFASVYYEHALRRAKSEHAESQTPTILGGVIAHELGHLLLGTNEHSRTGIMQPRWYPDQILQLMKGILLFTSEQSKLMREQARTRTRLQSENLDPGLIQASFRRMTDRSQGGR